MRYTVHITTEQNATGFPASDLNSAVSHAMKMMEQRSPGAIVFITHDQTQREIDEQTVRDLAANFPRADFSSPRMPA